MTDTIAALGNNYLRDYLVDGIPASTINDPAKSQGRYVFAQIDAAVTAMGLALGAGNAIAVAAHTSLDLAHADGTMGFVYNDPDATQNGIWFKSGASGVGSWSISPLSISANTVVRLQALIDGEATNRAYYISQTVAQITTETNTRVAAIAAMNTQKLDVAAKASSSQATGGTDDAAYMTPAKTKSYVDTRIAAVAVDPSPDVTALAAAVATKMAADFSNADPSATPTAKATGRKALGVAVDIAMYGGTDDGVTDNYAAFNSTKAAHPGATIAFRKVNTGVFLFSTQPDFTGVDVDAEPGISFKGDLYRQPGFTPRRLISADIVPTNGSPEYHFDFAPDWNLPVSLKQRFIDPEGLDRTVITSLSANTDMYAQTLTSWTTTDAWSSTSFAGGGTDTIVHNITTTSWTGSFIPVHGEDEITAYFDLAGGNYTMGIAVNSTGGWLILSIPPSGAASLYTKATGGTYVHVADLDWAMRTVDPSWAAGKSVWSVRIDDASHVSILCNGLRLLSYYTLAGDIVEVGFVAQQIAAGATTAQIDYFSKRRVTVAKDVQVMRLMIVGDSKSALEHGGWAGYMPEAIDGSSGIRLQSIDNRAVPGETALQQYNRLVAVGVGTNTDALVYVGTNDINTGADVTTMLTRIGEIIDLLQAAFVRVVVVIPEMWYGSTENPTGGGVADSGGAPGGGIVRAALYRFCAGKGVGIVDLIRETGPIYATFVGTSMDPYLRDNLHSTAFGHRIEAHVIGRAIVANAVPKLSRIVSERPLPSSGFRNGWSQNYAWDYSVSEEGVCTISGVLTPGTKTDGTVVYVLPRNLWPTTTQYMMPYGDVYQNGQLVISAADGTCTVQHFGTQTVEFTGSLTYRLAH